MKLTRRDILKSLSAPLVCGLSPALLGASPPQIPATERISFDYCQHMNRYAVRLRNPTSLTRPRFMAFTGKAQELADDLARFGGHAYDVSIHVDRHTSWELLGWSRGSSGGPEEDIIHTAEGTMKLTGAWYVHGYPLYCHLPSARYRDMLEIRLIPKASADSEAYQRDYFLHAWGL